MWLYQPIKYWPSAFLLDFKCLQNIGFDFNAANLNVCYSFAVTSPSCDICKFDRITSDKFA
jgi:hypothetical protein